MLKVKEFFTVGSVALDMNAFNHSYNWLKASLELIENEQYTLNDKLRILDKLANASLKVIMVIFNNAGILTCLSFHV